MDFRRSHTFLPSIKKKCVVIVTTLPPTICSVGKFFKFVLQFTIFIVLFLLLQLLITYVLLAHLKYSKHDFIILLPRTT